MTSSVSARGSTWKWRKLRAAILERDGYRCQICSEHIATEVDHIVPRHLGGSDHPLNLRSLCHRCHANRRDEIPEKPITSRIW